MRQDKHEQRPDDHGANHVARNHDSFAVEAVERYSGDRCRNNRRSAYARS